MDINVNRRQSIKETVEKTGEKSRRRSLFENPVKSLHVSSSFFENPAESFHEERNTDSHMKEWEQRWGCHNTDYVNVIELPEGYIKKIKGEINCWITGLEVMMERAEEFGSEIEHNIILEGCELSIDQKTTLQNIDAEINKTVQKLQAFLNSIEVRKHLKESEIKNMNRDVAFVGKLLGLKK